MHKIGHGSIIALGIALISVSVSVAATSSDDTGAWAFPAGLGSPAVPAPSDAKFGLPGSTMRLHEAQLHDPFTAVDWWPRSHSLPPPIVLHGHKPSAFACGYCHLPTGQGRPENAVLAGLPRDYIVRQIENMRNNARNGVQPDWGPTKKMHLVAADVSPSEAADAAAYFATQKYQSLVRV